MVVARFFDGLYWRYVLDSGVLSFGGLSVYLFLGLFRVGVDCCLLH